jgi:hypothetical protein
MSEEFFAKSQMFYNGYFPGGIYRLRNRSFSNVLGVRNNDENSRRVDIDQLLDVTKSYVSEWEAIPNGKVSGILKLHLQNGHLGIVSPEAVYVEPFPMMLQCTKCKVLDFYKGKTSNDRKITAAKKRLKFIQGKERISCKNPGCRGYMIQIEHVAVHRCGELSNLTIPGGARRIQDLGFKSVGGTFRNSFFYDVNNKQGAKFHALQENCTYCKHEYGGVEGTNKRATPAGNREAIFPHNVQYLCLKPQTGKLISRISAIVGSPGSPTSDLGIDIAEAVASCLIGLSQPDQLFEHLENVLQGGGPDKDAIEKLTQSLEEHKAQRDELISHAKNSGMSEDLLNSLVEKIDKSISEIGNQLAEASGKFSAVRNHLPDPALLQNLAARRRSIESALIEFDFLNKTQSLSQSIANETDAVKKDQRRQDAAYLHNQYGVKEVIHYSEMNVVMASLGYTREKQKPSEGPVGSVVPTILQGYEDRVNQSLTGKSIIYALPAKTEAIQIKFSSIAILQWCIDSVGWNDPGETVTGSESLAKAHLLKNCPALTLDPSDVRSGTKHRPYSESAPYHLIHTISHCLLSSLKRHTGYGEKSVVEYLLPMDLSFLLYVSSVQNYTAGGLLMLFKHHLRAWFDDASNFAFNCVFDPICSDKGSSCSRCVQIDLGCEAFNFGLSRCYIHGGKLEEGTKIHISNGFWQ